MSYTKHTWTTGEVITKELLNEIEQGIEDANNIIDDVEALNEEIQKKADIDGLYESLTAGNAEQLVSTINEEDETPYQFRTSGGSLDIGDREFDTIVGGSIVMNQMVADNPTLLASNATVSASDGVYTVTASEKNGFVYVKFNSQVAHKYIAISRLKLTTETTAIGYSWWGTAVSSCKATTEWQTLANIANIATASANYQLQIKDTRDSDRDAFQIKNLMLVDLTQKYNPAIADYIYSLEQSTAGAGVEWLRKHDPKMFEYQPYNAGELKHVSGLQSHDMVGFNQWDEVVESGYLDLSTGANQASDTRYRSKNFTPVLPNTEYYIKNSAHAVANNVSVRLYFYDGGKNFISSPNATAPSRTFTTPSNCYYMRFFINEAVSNFDNTVCINLHWDGERDGEYEPYKKYSYPLDSDLILRGVPKLDVNNNLYFDGDTYESDGTVTRRYGVVDLGTLTYQSNGTNSVIIMMPEKKVGSQYTICDQMIQVGSTVSVNDMAYGTYKCYAGTANVAVKITGITTHNASTMLGGMMFVYELATPTTETAEPYTNPQVVDDFGTEEYITDSIVPVGHITKYQPNLRAKLEMAPDSPDANGDYVVRHNNGTNTYVTLSKELPSLPADDGTYTLSFVKLGSAQTLFWKEEES